MVDKYNILVTGSDGQLGNSIKKNSNDIGAYNFYFKNKEQLDISNINLIETYINNHEINVIINCAAFTNVDQAENEKELADLINHISISRIAKICSEKNIQLIHISTDFVFDGLKLVPYTEIDKPNPINYYGLSKLNGEKKIFKYDLNKSIIIRTSWLYSERENNFVTKIINKINEGKNFEVVDDEFGSPTNADDLAKVILSIIPKLNNDKTEIYHFSNNGYCSRYDFASEINKIVKGKSYILPKNNTELNVIRPKYSVLDSNKIINEFNLKISNWKDSLAHYLNYIKKNKSSVYEI